MQHRRNRKSTDVVGYFITLAVKQSYNNTECSTC